MPGSVLPDAVGHSWFLALFIHCQWFMVPETENRIADFTGLNYSRRSNGSFLKRPQIGFRVLPLSSVWRWQGSRWVACWSMALRRSPCARCVVQAIHPRLPGGVWTCYWCFMSGDVALNSSSSCYRTYSSGLSSGSMSMERSNCVNEFTCDCSSAARSLQ